MTQMSKCLHWLWMHTYYLCMYVCMYLWSGAGASSPTAFPLMNVSDHVCRFHIGIPNCSRPGNCEPRTGTRAVVWPTRGRRSCRKAYGTDCSLVYKKKLSNTSIELWSNCWAIAEIKHFLSVCYPVNTLQFKLNPKKKRKYQIRIALKNMHSNLT